MWTVDHFTSDFTVTVSDINSLFIYFFSIKFIVKQVFVYVIAQVGVKFRINFTSVRLSGNKIARDEAECYLPVNLTRVKFVLEITRLTVLLPYSRSQKKVSIQHCTFTVLDCTFTVF